MQRVTGEVNGCKDLAAERDRNEESRRGTECNVDAAVCALPYRMGIPGRGTLDLKAVTSGCLDINSTCLDVIENMLARL